MSTESVTDAKQYSGSVSFYRIMAFATGVVLLSGCIGLILQTFVGGIREGVGFLWLGHGYLYLVYVIATFNLGVKMRWPIVRMFLVALAGTIPTMSFVAEHAVMQYVRARLAGPGSTD